MDGKTYHHFNDDKKKVQHDADDKGPVDFFEVHGVMMVPMCVTMTMIVAMSMGVRH
jgi:hypothetical protein